MTEKYQILTSGLHLLAFSFAKDLNGNRKEQYQKKKKHPAVAITTRKASATSMNSKHH